MATMSGNNGLEGLGVPVVVLDGGSAVVPDAELLFTAVYTRVGSDLLLTGADGAQVLIQGYFAAGEPPILFSPTGAIMAPHVVAALVGDPVAWQVAQVGPLEGPQPIGQAQDIVGTAQVVRGGVTIQLNTGDPVFQGDVVQTGLGSELAIGFADGTIFSLSANARMVLDGMVYDPAGSSNSLVLSIVHGTFSFVTGQIAPTGGMDVNTPVATIGIRGTTVHGILESIAGPLTVFLGVNQSGSNAIAGLFNPLTGQPMGSISDLQAAYVISSPGADLVVRGQTPAESQFIDQRATSVHNIQSTFQFNFDLEQPILQPGDGDANQTGDETGLQPQGGDPVVAEAGTAPDSGGIGIEQEFEDAANENQVSVDLPGVDDTNELPGPGGPGGPPPPEPPIIQEPPTGGVDTNQAPDAADDDATTDAGAPVSIAVLANDSDPDGNSLSVSAVTQGANGAVAINGDGTVTYTPTPGFSGTDSFTYTASDGLAGDSATVTVTVNAPPTVALAGTLASLAEDADTSAAIKVADIVVTDDAIGVNTLALAGADSGLFEIVGSELFLKAGAALDFETNPSLDVTVTVDDPAVGASPDDSAALVLPVTDVNEAPSVALAGTLASLAEDAGTSTAIKVADIVVTDDGTGTNTLALTGADSGLFEIVGTELFLKAGTALDFATNPSLDVTVTVDDAAVGATPDDSASLALAITEVGGTLAGDVRPSGVSSDAIPLDPRATFLRTSNDSGALGKPELAILDLATLGFAAGDIVTVRALGDFQAGVGFTDDSTNTGAVFSGSATLLAGNNLARVPDAIDALGDVITGPTFFDRLPTDIPEDFSVSSSGEAAGTVVRVPVGATHLFVAARDSFYGDNSDPDRDYAVRLVEPLVVGETGVGTLTLNAGETLSEISIILGFAPGSMGTGVIQGAGASLSVADTLFIGLGGTGALDIVHGGRVSVAGDLFLGTDDPDATGTVLVSGMSSLSVGNSINVGGAVGGAGGVDSLTIQNGAMVAASSIAVRAGGALIAGAGSIAGDIFNNGGTVTLGDGPGTLRVTGNYTQDADGELILNLGKGGAVGDLVGDATFTPGTTVLLQQQADVRFGDAFALVALGGPGLTTADVTVETALGFDVHPQNEGDVIAFTTVVAGFDPIKNVVMDGVTITDTLAISNAIQLYDDDVDNAASKGTVTIDINADAEMKALVAFNANVTTTDIAIGGGGTAQATFNQPTVADNLFVGDALAGKATAIIGSAAALTDPGVLPGLTIADSIVVDNGGAGTAELYVHGPVTVNNAAASGLIVGHDLGSTGALHIDGGRLTANTRVEIGGKGDGTLDITRGGVLDATGDFVFVGNAAGSSGAVTVTGDGSRLAIGGSMDIGRFGAGHLAVLDGGTVSNDPTGVTTIGREAGSLGTVEVRGTDAATISTLDAGAFLLVGEDFDFTAVAPLGAGTGGTGTLIIGDFGVVNAGEVFIGTDGRLEGAGSLAADTTLEGGTLAPGASAGTLIIDGDLTMDGGVLEIELGGTAPGLSDLIDVSGAAAINHGLVEFDLIDGYLPLNGDSIVFLDADGGLSATAASVSVAVQGVTPDFDFSLAFGANDASLTALTDATSGNSIIFRGGDLDDAFSGGAGNDTLRGGVGADTLTGAAGADTFVLAAGEGGSTLAAADLITDFDVGVDAIGLAGGLAFADLTVAPDGAGGTAISISLGTEILAVLDGIIVTVDDLVPSM